MVLPIPVIGSTLWGKPVVAIWTCDVKTSPDIQIPFDLLETCDEKHGGG
jgi:hypothetical protein